MIHDHFTELKVSPQRRWQMRARAAGLCVLCGEKAVNASYCLKHAIDVREAQRRRVGSRRRNIKAKSYKLEKAKNKLQ